MFLHVCLPVDAQISYIKCGYLWLRDWGTSWGPQVGYLSIWWSLWCWVFALCCFKCLLSVQNCIIFHCASTCNLVLRGAIQTRSFVRRFHTQKHLFRESFTTSGFFLIAPPEHTIQQTSSNVSGAAMAVLDRVSSAFSTVESQTTFSHSIRGDMVLFILAKIRHTLFFSTESRPSPPLLLSAIVDVAAEQICELFQSSVTSCWTSCHRSSPGWFQLASTWGAGTFLVLQNQSPSAYVQLFFPISM